MASCMETVLLGLFTFTLIDASLPIAHDLVIVYPLQIRSERDLPNCATANTVCSILQQRYWLPAVLHRYCRCPEGLDCPSDWAGPNDVPINETSLVRARKGLNYSLPINNRAQMKFCSTIKAIDTCAQNQTAINVRTVGAGQNVTDPSLFPSTRILCKCPSNHTWQISHGYDTEKGQTSAYTCKPLKRCRYRSTCGAITTDTFSVYPHCLCRRGSVCTIENRTLAYVEELHYSGSAYLGVCKP